MIGAADAKRLVRWHTCSVCRETYWECPEGYDQHRELHGHGPKRFRLRNRQSISAAVRRLVYERDEFTCQECGFSDPDWEPIIARKRYEGNYLTLDHVTPWVFGGTNNETNLTTLCFDCNVAKGTRDKERVHRILDYMREHGDETVWRGPVVPPPSIPGVTR